MYRKMQRGETQRDFICNGCSNSNSDSNDTEMVMPPVQNTSISFATDLLEDSATSLRTDDTSENNEISESLLSDTATSLTADGSFDDFNISASFERVEGLEESVIEEPQPANTIPEDTYVPFEVIKEGSAKGKDLLIDPAGYGYTQKVGMYSIIRDRRKSYNNTAK